MFNKLYSLSFSISLSTMGHVTYSANHENQKDSASKPNIYYENCDSDQSSHTVILTKRTDLHIAVSTGRRNQVEDVLNKDNDIDIDAKDKNGQTALHLAVFCRFDDIVEVLLRHHPDVNLQDKTSAGFSPLHWTAFYGYPEIAKRLILAGAKIDSKVEEKSSKYKGRRAIDLSVRKGFLKVVELLIEAGADLNATDKDSLSPLQVARKKKYSYIMRALDLEESDEKKSVKLTSLPPTPCIYVRSYVMDTPKKRIQFFKDLGLKYLFENQFSSTCLPLSRLKLDKSEYDSISTARYALFIKNHHVVPCTLKWVNDQVGYGFFSGCDLNSEDYIIEFTGKIIESHALSKKSWSWGYRRANDIDNFPYSTCIDSTEGGNEARFINHSERGNARIKKVFFENSWHQIYIASQPIKKGDQFLINYGSGYWSKKQHMKVQL